VGSSGMGNAVEQSSMKQSTHKDEDEKTSYKKQCSAGEDIHERVADLILQQVGNEEQTQTVERVQVDQFKRRRVSFVQLFNMNQCH
jgi:hypothetical protein